MPGVGDEHPAHDVVTRGYRQLRVFEQEYFLQAQAPRAKWPAGSGGGLEPPRAGKLWGLELLFEALVLILCQQETFAAAARAVGETRHRVAVIGETYVELATV
jgi:hypothetical protein